MEKKNIAILLGDIRDVYSNAVAKGAMQAAREKLVNLLIVPGRYFQQTNEYLLGEYEYQYQTLFSYFTENNVDLLILCAGATGFVNNCDTRNSLNKFRERIGDMPLITVSGDDPEVPNIRYDNNFGVVKGVTYMVEKRGCKKVAMVGGPKGNADSKERVNAYREALEKLGIAFDEEYVVYGDFTERTEITVYGFLKTHPEVDGLVFANDRMAVGGYEAAKKLGLVVGRDIAFLGFDNIEKDQYMDPPLASVDADAEGLGYAAVCEALKYFERGYSNGRVIPSRFVLRESILSGEGDELIEEALGFTINDETDFENLAQSSFDYIYNPLDDDSMKIALFESYRRFLFDLSAVIFANNVVSDRVEVLRFSYKQLFDQDETGNIDIGRFMIVLKALEQTALQNSKNEEKKDFVVRMTSYVYRHLSGLISLREANRAYRLKKMQHEIYRISADMVGFHNISDKTYANVLSNFERFGINYCFLYLFEKPIRNEISDTFLPDETVYLKSALVNGEIFSPTERQQKIPLSEMFRFAFSESGERTHLILLNLYIRNMIYGVILCDIPYEIFNYYESFNYQISNAVRTIRLLRENEEKGAQLKESLELLTRNNIQLDSMSKSDELTGINNRRGFLTEAEKMLDDVWKKEPDIPKYVLVGYADADGLKGINDTFGHDEGDNLIITSANVIKEAVGEKGIVGRLGGDEFAAILFADSASDAENLKERAEDLINTYNKISEKAYKLSISFGTFLFPLTKDIKITQLLESADREMYRVKKDHRAGRRRGDFLPND